MKQRLELFYETLGDRGIMFMLYAFSVVVNSLFTWNMDLPQVFPDEINVAGISALYSGRDWSELLKSTGVSGGYAGALFYAPMFIIFNNPYAVYKGMLIVNALLISFIPLIVYYMATKLGVARMRHKLLISLCCGMYISYIANSKFVWNETITCLMGWILVMCVFSAWDKKSGYSRFSMSLLLGFLCAAAYAANARLLAVVAAVVLTVIFSYVIFREKLVNIPIFVISLIVSFITEHFARGLVHNMVFGAEGVTSETQLISWNAGGAKEVFGLIFSNIYSIMTSTLGLGAIAAALTFVLIIKWIREGIKNRGKTLEGGTRVYEPNQHEYGVRLSVFALMQFLISGCVAVFSAMLTFGTGNISMESTVFGRYTDNIAPMASFLVLSFIFTYGIDLKKLWLGAGVYAYACLCFAVSGYPLVSGSGRYLQSSVPGLFPMSGDLLTGMSYVVMSSCVFTVFALLMVFVSCSRRHRKALIGVTMLGVIVYTTMYTGTVYLPRVGIANAEACEPYRRVSDLLYNNPQSPPIMIYDDDMALAATVQFLNSNIRVEVLEEGERVPESCLLIARNGVQPPFEGGSYDSVGRTDVYSVYAYGEIARDFMRYSSASDTKNPPS